MRRVSSTLRNYFRFVKLLYLLRENVGGCTCLRIDLFIVSIIIIIEFVIAWVYLFSDLFSIFLGELLSLLVEFILLAHLVLDGRVVILPIEAKMALHVVQGCIREGLRKPMYILRRCRLVPFLSRNSSMLYCELIIYKECHIMKHNSNPRRVLSASSHY
jgi:hypothetical protein